MVAWLGEGPGEWWIWGSGEGHGSMVGVFVRRVKGGFAGVGKIVCLKMGKVGEERCSES